MQLCQQEDSMRVSVNTIKYDYSQVKVKMNIMFVDRRRLVQEMQPVNDIVELYPALSVTNLLIREINLRSDPFSTDIIQTLTSNCTKLARHQIIKEKKRLLEKTVDPHTMM
ncbi:unnamed protein product [Rotaria sordida]|uniref:Uncharacterized protein n=1 Tax=Rotaria sordida TaxID=392033 RepID=A0A815NWS3_9BILA|nr:unnamed protein product [Rotaria sordida]CAF1634121.1 unnamed protein product [Rotaria sordida]